MGVIRVVLVRLLEPHRNDRRREAIVAAAREAFPTIPGVVDFEAGHADGDWDIVLLVHFAALDAIAGYRAHPVHTGFLGQHLQPYMDTLEARNFTT